MMVVTNLKREAGRPLKERETVEKLGLRKKAREGEAGRDESRWCWWCGPDGGAAGFESEERGGELVLWLAVVLLEMSGLRRGLVDGVF